MSTFVAGSQTAAEAYAAGEFGAALQALSSLPNPGSGPTADGTALKVKLNTTLAEHQAKGVPDVCGLLTALLELREEGLEKGILSVTLAPLNYNIGVCALSLDKIELAMDALESVFSSVSPLDERLGVVACTALLDTYFACLGRFGGLRSGDTMDPIERRQSLLLRVDCVLAYMEKTLLLTSEDLGMSNEELETVIQLYRVRLALAARNSRAAKREVKAVTVKDANQPAPVFAKAAFDYSRLSYARAVKVLAACERESDDTPVLLQNNSNLLSAVYFNNLACLHHAMGKHHVAALYGSRALEAHTTATEDTENENRRKGAKQTGVGGGVYGHRSLPPARRCDVLYNTGTALLMGGSPELAFACFASAAEGLREEPRVWLRMAECCAVRHASVATTDRDKYTSAVVAGVCGKSHLRGIVLPTEPRDAATRGRNARTDVAPPTESASTAAAAMTLDYAEECCRNGLALLGYTPESKVYAPRGGAGSGGSAGGPAAPAASDGGGGGGGVGGESGVEGVSTTHSDVIELTSARPSWRTGLVEPDQLGASAGGSGAAAGADPAVAGPPGLSSAAGGEGEGEPTASDSLRAAVIGVHSALLCLRSYIGLCRGAPAVALSSASELLSLAHGLKAVHAPPALPHLVFLAHTYSAEALCALDAPTQALSHLSSAVLVAQTDAPELGPCRPTVTTQVDSSGDAVELVYAGVPARLPGWNNVANTAAVHAGFFVNLTTAFVLNGELVQAREALRQAQAAAPSNPAVVLLTAYMHLRDGVTAEALSVLKRHRAPLYGS